jgi:hypothetical protein
MTDEQPQEAKPSFLDEVKAERASLEKVRDEIKQNVERMEQLKAESILSGTSDAGQTPVPPHVETPKEYAERLSKGIL